MEAIPALILNLLIGEEVRITHLAVLAIMQREIDAVAAKTKTKQRLSPVFLQKNEKQQNIVFFCLYSFFKRQTG
jgi:hypothetical protein